jgi:P-type Ca2+ transporter type 2C
MLPYQQSTSQTLKDLDVTSEHGLDVKQVRERQRKYGPNQLDEGERISPWKIFFEQFKSVLVIILIIATIVSAVLGEWIDASVIMVIVILNAVMGFIQEYNAEKSIEALKKMTKVKAKVLRDGKQHIIDACEVTIGDILVLETGDKIAADARVIQEINLEAQEAVLTGESLPVAKQIENIDEDCVLGDQKNMLFSGTVITKWRGMAVVTSIGMKTELGKIADMMQSVEDQETHLQKQLGTLGKKLGILTVAVCAVIFLSYFFINHVEWQVAFLTAIALAVAAIPEGLPAVVTIALSLGVKRMVKKNALMRKLPSVETLGSVDVICTDKTGTLTKNEMTVKKLRVNNEVIDVEGTGYTTKGSFSKDPKHFLKLLEIGMLCNTSMLDGDEVVGDPTEGCLIVSALKAEIDEVKLKKQHTRYGEVPFDSERKMMTTVCSDKGLITLFSKGAPEVILGKCDRILIDGEEKKLTSRDREHILRQNEQFGNDALRVLGFAYKWLEWKNDKKKEDRSKEESHMVFVGLQAMIDPPREEVKIAVAKCKTAGIRVVMITGDNIITATAIARELGIEGEAREGKQLKSVKDIQKSIKKVNIFARVNPEHKQQIVAALKEKGHIVAMTGDGVNDAPALKKADIGVAMWITGTDVSKEAADMILTDDNFASIVSAVEEWRWIYDNVKKFVNYLLSSNMGEIVIIFVASLMGLPLPLLAIHLLWINLVTDGLPAIALGVDPNSPNSMRRPPRKSDEQIVSKDMIRSIGVIAILMLAGALFVFWKHYKADLDQARTAVFILLVLMELVRIPMIRSQYGIGLFSNKRLLAAMLGSIALVLLVVYTPLSGVFKTSTPSLAIRGEIFIALAVLVVVGVWFTRGYEKITKKRKSK